MSSKTTSKLFIYVFYILLMVVSYQFIALYIPTQLYVIPFEIINVYNFISTIMFLTELLAIVATFTQEENSKPTLEEYKESEKMLKKTYLNTLIRTTSYSSYLIIILGSTQFEYIYTLLITTTLVIGFISIRSILREKARKIIENFENNLKTDIKL